MSLLVAKAITSSGLTLNIVGALLIWWFGIPKVTDREGGTLLELSVKGGDAAKARHKRKVRLYDLAARSGGIVLILGFGLQLLGIWLNA